MATYFGYVEREADSYVNWADVGRTITNTVDEIDRVRTEKKAAIDAAYKEGLEFINDRPAGENEEANKLTMNLAYNSAENLKIQYNLLKSGKVQVKDFAAYVQNQNDNIKGFYETIGTIQESFKKRQDRMKAEASQGIEILGGEDLEKYGNIGNLEAYYNANGSLTFGLLGEPDKDGVRKVLPGVQNIMSVNQLKGAVNEEYNYYDYVKDASRFVENLGESIMSYRTLGDRMKAGTITEIVDKTGELDLVKAAAYGITDPAEIDRLKKVVADFKEAEEKYIKASLSEYNMSSVITEELNYVATFDKTLAEKDPKKYMYAERQSNGVIKPMPTPEQEKEAENFMRNQMRQMIDKKLNIKPYTDQAQDKPVQQASETTVRAGKEAISADALGSEIGKLYGADLRTRETALSGFNQYTGVVNLYFEEDSSGNVSIKGYTNHGGNVKEVFVPYMRNGKLVDVQTFGKAFAPVVGKLDLANENFGQFTKALNPYSTYNADWGKGKDEAETKKNRSPQSWTPKAPMAEETNKIEEVKAKLGLDIFGQGETEATGSLGTVLSSYGVTASETGWGAGNWVKLTPPKGSKVPPIDVQVAWKDQTNRGDQQAKVIRFMEAILNEGTNSVPKPPPPPPPGG